ncbi:hypothetical protein C4D60_Mb05t03010 [Musa balbisiana]|uniref:Uncharacterized protein n=1 Tax=Musa balbisiana TaxID=52838 RepID=A0A4S8JTA6_MUSBA|nr:hypothetical protein C4D60_Mb05t03010 [Musa balbisiana]
MENTAYVKRASLLSGEWCDSSGKQNNQECICPAPRQASHTAIRGLGRLRRRQINCPHTPWFSSVTNIMGEAFQLLHPPGLGQHKHRPRIPHLRLPPVAQRCGDGTGSRDGNELEEVSFNEKGSIGERSRGKEIHRTGQANERMLAFGNGGLRVRWSLRSEAVGDGVECIHNSYVNL